MRSWPFTSLEVAGSAPALGAEPGVRGLESEMPQAAPATVPDQEAHAPASLLGDWSDRLFGGTLARPVRPAVPIDRARRRSFAVSGCAQNQSTSLIAGA